MRVFNNMAAMATLNENDRDLKKANKSLAQAASQCWPRPTRRRRA